MPLECSSVQRVNTFVAAMEPRFDEVARTFFDRFERACPAAKGLRPHAGKRARHEFAASVSMVLKNLGNLGAADAVFAYASDRCRRAGMGMSEMKTAQACLLGVMRDAAGAAWNSQIESDMNMMVSECFSKLNMGESKVRRAAA